MRWITREEAEGLIAAAKTLSQKKSSYLSLHQHQMRGLGSALLKALTVVHNFVIKRADGTTAAIRFFGRPPDQTLFNHLCQVLPLPARPRKRSRCPNEDAQLLAA
ncbi:hypothetical protein CCP4SC76_7360001 [Gammaproteobacteria bacterium]